MSPSKKRTKDLALIVLIALSILSKVYSENVPLRGNNAPRRKEGTKLDNQVHMSVVNAKYHEFLEQQDNFLSSTIRFSLYPIQHTIDESQASSFEKALTSFLKITIKSHPEHQFWVLRALVTHVKSIGIADTQESEPMVKDHTLEIQTVVSAQQQMENPDDWITPKEFGDIIINLCSIYEDELIQKLFDTEDELTNKVSVDSIQNKKIFSNIQHIDASLDRVVFGSGLTAIGKGILICFCILAVVMAGLFFLVWFTRRKEIHEGLEDFKKQKKLRDFPSKDKYSDLIFVPYSEAQLSPPVFQRKKETSKKPDDKTNNLVTISEEDDDKNITADTGLSDGLNDTFDSNIYYDTHSVASVSSMSTIGLSSIGGGSQISTDGSLLMGECFAPPGKLGIAIDTLKGQPVVHRVRDESPLAGVLRRLDIIVAVDDEDTSSMTAAEVTMLMAKKLGQKRKISYLRGKRVVKELAEKIV